MPDWGPYPGNTCTTLHCPSQPDSLSLSLPFALTLIRGVVQMSAPLAKPQLVVFHQQHQHQEDQCDHNQTNDDYPYNQSNWELFGGG